MRQTDPLFLPVLRRGAALAGVAQGEAVLLIEDTPLVRIAVTRMLVELGYLVIAAADPEAALAALDSDSRIDLLFTDMALPGGIDGEELVMVARRRRPEMPVLFTSGYTETRLRDLAGAGGRLALISRPYTKAELAAELRALLDGKTAAN